MRITKTMNRRDAHGDNVRTLAVGAAGIACHRDTVAWDAYSETHTFAVQFTPGDLTMLRAVVAQLEEIDTCSS